VISGFKKLLEGKNKFPLELKLTKMMDVQVAVGEFGCGFLAQKSVKMVLG